MRGRRDLSRMAVGIVMAAALLGAPTPTWAGGVIMEHFRLRVGGVQGYGALLVIRDFWERPIGWMLVRTSNGQAELPWDPSLCNGPCRVEIEREFTEQEFREAWRDLQLMLIRDRLSAPILPR